MKKFLPLLFLIGFTKTFSQGYKKLLADSITEFYISNDVPAIRMSNPYQNLSGCLYIYAWGTGTPYIALGDSIYKTNKYKKFWDPNNSFQGIIREDTGLKKIYFIPYCDTSETLLYDFSLQIGNTINYTFNNSSSYLQSGTYTVDSIVSKRDYRSNTHRHFYLSSPVNQSGRYLEVVEGVGSTYHPLFLYCDFWDGMLYGCGQSQGMIVSCKSDNTQRIYYDSCFYAAAASFGACFNNDTCGYFNHCGSIDKNIHTEYLDIVPNPSSGNFKIHTDVSSIRCVEVLNLQGEVLQTTPVKSGKDVDVSNLPEGIYILRATGEKGLINRKLILTR